MQKSDEISISSLFLSILFLIIRFSIHYIVHFRNNRLGLQVNV